MTEALDVVAACAAARADGCDGGIRRAFDFLGKRWNGVILGTLSGGPLGFAELRRGVGTITDSVLSDRLQLNLFSRGSAKVCEVLRTTSPLSTQIGRLTSSGEYRALGKVSP